MSFSSNEELFSKIYLPKRANLEQNRARVEGSEPTEAFELLAPSSWVGEPKRELPWGANPPTSVDNVLLVVADPEGVELAEEMTREIVERLRFVGAKPFGKVTWRLWPAHIWGPGVLPGFPKYEPLQKAINMLFEWAPNQPTILANAWFREREALIRERNWPVTDLAYAAFLADAWASASANKASPMAGLANPFEPLITLLCTGHGFCGVEDDVVHLVMPM